MANGKIDLEFDVGEVEKHHVRFTFDQTWGPVRVWVDDRIAVKGFEVFSLSKVKTYAFAVGTGETHEVEIVKTRARTMGGFRKQSVVGRVDGEVVASI
jgi:hypothetical protein